MLQITACSENPNFTAPALKQLFGYVHDTFTADLPAALWQSIYTLIGSQKDICNGMLVCTFLASTLPHALHEAVVTRPHWDQVPGELHPHLVRGWSSLLKLAGIVIKTEQFQLWGPEQKVEHDCPQQIEHI